jgi:hypothetical protein
MRARLGTTTALRRSRRRALIVSTTLSTTLGRARGRAVALTLPFLVGLFAFAVLGGGCIASNHPLYPDLGSFCTAKAKATCQIAGRCGIKPDVCETYQYQQCAMMNQQSPSSTRIYNPDNAKTCVDAVNGAYANAEQNTGEVAFGQLFGSGSIDDKCSRVFTGNLMALSPCTMDEDCSGDLVCARAQPDKTTTVCATPTPVPRGQACQNPGDQCDTDSYCSQQGALWLCSMAAGPGEACSDGIPCVSSQHCVTNTCSPRAAAGGSCSTNNDCGPDAPYCDPNAHFVCTSGLTFAGGAYDCLGTEGLLPPGSVGNAAGDAGSE